MTRKMKILGVLLVLFFLVVFAVGDDVCIICDLIAEQPQAEMLLNMNDVDYEISAYLYYENFSSEPPRTPIDNSLLFVYIESAEGDKELLKFFTDDEGAAVFDFSDYAEHAQTEQISYNFQIIYCPFCHPEDEGYPCGFDECVDYSGIEVPSGIGGTNPVDSVPLAEGAAPLPETSWNRHYYLPTSAGITYSPPPAPAALVPAFCFPLLLIFAMLGGALYYTGRNPFAAFTLGSPRVGRHIRYTPGGRGMRVSGRYVAQSIKGGVGEAKGMHTARKEAKEKGKSAAKAGWKAGAKAASWKDSLSLGSYGMVMGSKGRIVRSGDKAIQVGGGKGLKQLIKGAPGAFKQAKKKYKTSTYFTMPSKRGEVGLKGGAKGFFAGYGQRITEEVVRTGGAILGSTILVGIFGSTLAKKMGNFVINKEATAVAEGYATRDIEKEEQKKVFAKLDTLVKKEKATEIVVDGKTYYEMDQTIKNTDGTTSVSTIRIDKESFKEGKIAATQIVNREGFVEERHFSGQLNANKGTFETTLTAVAITKGSGDNAIVATYSIAEPAKFPGDHTLKLEAMTFGENIKADAGAYKEGFTFVQGFNGRVIEAETLATAFMGADIDKGVTVGGLATELGTSQYRIDAACERIKEATINAGVHAYYKTDENFKNASENFGTGVNTEMKKVKISNEGALLLAHTLPEAGDKKVKDHYTTQANSVIAQQGEVKAKEKYTQPTPAQQAGASAVYGLGTDLVSMKKEKALEKTKQNIDKMNLNPEQKNEAYQVATEFYSDAKETAKTWNSAANEATNTYRKLEKVAKTELEPVYKGKENEVKDVIVHTGLSAGISTYYELQAAENMDKGGKKDYMQDEVAKSIITGSYGAMVKTPEQAFLTELVSNGTYTEPEKPLPPKLPKFKPDASPEEMMKAYEKTFGNYAKKAEEYQKTEEEWKTKKEDLIYGKGLNTAAGSALVLTSAIKKDIELPEEIYGDAVKGMTNAEPEKWKEAGTKAMEEIDKQQKKKRKEELKGLKGEKEIGL